MSIKLQIIGEQKGSDVKKGEPKIKSKVGISNKYNSGAKVCNE